MRGQWDNWVIFGLVLMFLVFIGALIKGFLTPDPVPRVKIGDMKISEAMEMMDNAVNWLHGKQSVVYPGLTGIQALQFILEGFIASIPKKKSDQDVMLVHPRVETRIRQVCDNKILRGEPGPDPSIAAIFFLSHPDEKRSGSFQISLGVRQPEPITEVDSVELPSGLRKFLS